MRLLLLRHGEAGFNAPTDQQRRLTDNGRQQLQQMLSVNAAKLDGVERIIHSPFVRTTETADLVNSVQSAALSPSALLTPESSPQAVVDWLAEQRDEVLILVTHQPLIGALVSLLCEGNLRRPEPMLPGTMAIIELTFPAAGLGQLQHLLR